MADEASYLTSLLTLSDFPGLLCTFSLRYPSLTSPLLTMTKILETIYDQLSLLLLTSPEELPTFREEEAEAMRQLKKIIGDVEKKMQGKEDLEIAELLRYMRQVVLGEVERGEEGLPPPLRNILV
jgi:hypothetical protein